MAAFKSYIRGARNMAVEENFNLGMRFTDTPLAVGNCKALVNFDFKDSGAVLTPRSGYQQLHEAALGSETRAYQVHHTAQGTVLNTATGQDRSARYVLLGYDEPDTDWFDFSKAKILLEQSFNSDFDDTEHKSFLQVLPTLLAKEIEGQTYHDQFLIRRTERARTQLLHNISLVDPTVFQGMPYLSAYTMLNNEAILPVRYTAAGESTAVDGFARLRFTTDASGVVQAKLLFVSPQVLTPTEAVNYGYNMLSDTPYAFSDVVSAAVPANHIIMEGVLPYADEACTQPKFNARVGENVTFRLFAQYPDQTSQFKFRWEVREVGSDNVTVYEDQQATDKTYQFLTDRAKNVTPNPDTDYVKLTFQPPYKQFSVAVTAYSVTDLTEPLQVMTLASYSLTDTALTNNLDIRSYPLYTTGSLCTWKQRVVLWGVTGADNMIFVSDVNNPAYFPYPQGAEIFEEKVVACVPYLNDLLVFTETKLYRLVWSADGLSFKSSMIQDRLYMSAFDRETITTVQNMVFFKNGNYFYMVVPKTNSSEPGALQLAPISNSITNMLDRFQETVKTLFFQLYNPTDSSKFPYVPSNAERDIVLHDYHSYLDNSVVRNVYKFKLIDRDRTTKEPIRELLYFDFMLNYDTLLRTWTCYIMQSNATRLWPYRQNVTDTTVYINIVNDSATVNTLNELGEIIATGPGFASRCVFIKPNVLSARDAFPIAVYTVVQTRLLRNHQYFDSGYRDHDTQTKKRYREIQFKVNNISQESLQFGTEFMIDDNLRKSLFRYETRHITDPNSADYGYFYVERVFDDPAVSAGATILEDTDALDEPYISGEYTVPDYTIMLQSNQWILGVSQLSDVSVAKVRMKVSGKGYSPRLILVSFNDKLYELLNHNWVYRTMNAR